MTAQPSGTGHTPGRIPAVPPRIRALRFPCCGTAAEPFFQDCTVNNAHCWLNERRTAWTVLLSYPVLLPTYLLSHAAMLFALTVLHRSAKFRLLMPALSLIQSNPQELQCICEQTLHYASLCCSGGDQEPSQLHISAGALLKNRSFLCYSTGSWPLPLSPSVSIQPVQTQWLSTPLCCYHSAVISLMLKDSVQVFINKSQGTIISLMDQITESINGITHPTTLEKYQIMLTEFGSSYEILS